MIEFKDLFTIQYARHDGIDFEKKIAISIKYLEMSYGKGNRQIFKRRNLHKIIIYKNKLIKDQNIYIGRFTIM